MLAAGKDEEARSRLRQIQASSLDGDRYLLKVADVEHFLGEHESALLHAHQAIAEDPEQRYWPRGFCASTIEGAVLWSTDHTAAEEALRRSEHIDRDRLEGGDEGYMPHIDLAAVHAIRGDIRPGCAPLRAALHAGWRYSPSLFAIRSSVVSEATTSSSRSWPLTLAAQLAVAADVDLRLVRQVRPHAPASQTPKPRNSGRE